MPAPAVRVGVFALLGAALLAWPAHIFRVDVSGGNCALQPPLADRWPAALVYAVAVILLGLAWREALRAHLSLRTSFLLALAVHAVALVFPPYLSTDPVYYAVCGKALAARGAGMPLEAALPGHPWLELLPPEWRSGSSAYFWGFDQLSRVIAIATGDSMTLALRGYQLVGALCTFGTAFVLSRAFDAGPERDRAAALVLFSPLAIIEATQNGHNDAILMILMSLFAWATVRRRTPLALASLAAGVLIKASALLAVGFEYGRRLLRPARRLLTPRRVLIAGSVVVLAALATLLALQDRLPAGVRAQVGSPSDQWEHCTHSVECLPRAFLRYVLGFRKPAWMVGLAFRGAGALWVLWAAARAAADEDAPATVLRWISTTLFIYYLLFHGWMEAWYLLSLLPLVVFGSPSLAPVIKLYLFTVVSYYPLDFLLDCSWNPIAVGCKEFFEAFLVTGIPMFWLIGRTRKRARAA